MAPPALRRLLLGLTALALFAGGGWVAWSRHRAADDDPMAPPTAPWGQDHASDLRALRLEFQVFDDGFQSQLTQAASAAGGPSAVTNTNWPAVWYLVRATGVATTPADLTAGLVARDPAKQAAFREFVSKVVVAYAVGHPRETAAAYLPYSAVKMGTDPSLAENADTPSPAPQTDASLLAQTFATLDARLATVAAEHQVEVSTVQPDPELIAGALADGELDGSRAIQAFAAYEAAFTKLSTAAPAAPGATP